MVFRPGRVQILNKTFLLVHDVLFIVKNIRKFFKFSDIFFYKLMVNNNESRDDEQRVTCGVCGHLLYLLCCVDER